MATFEPTASSECTRNNDQSMWSMVQQAGNFGNCGSDGRRDVNIWCSGLMNGLSVAMS